MSQQAYPLYWPVRWPRTRYPSTAPFGDHSRARARDTLRHELALLGASKIVLSTNIPLRQDGLPRADWRQPTDKGVAVYFDLKGKPHVLACDRWAKVEHNFWAIAKDIEATRGKARWGVGSIEQAFAGYAALPERTESPEENCWTPLGIPPGSDADAINAAFRRLAPLAHPDTGGSHAAMSMLNRAREAALASLKT